MVVEKTFLNLISKFILGLQAGETLTVTDPVLPSQLNLKLTLS